MFFYINRILNKFKRKNYSDIDPDLIFLDSKNLPDFDTYQFEGRLEKPISKKSFSFFTSFFIIAIFVFVLRIIDLQIINGDKYRERSENNKLKKSILVAPRGIVYDRIGKELIWNEKSKENINEKEDISLRKYINIEGFGNLLGFVKYPAKDKSGFYYEEDFLPKDGIESYLNSVVGGKNGVEYLETSVDGLIVSNALVQNPRPGRDVTLSIDSRIQEYLFKFIKDLSLKVGFQGGAGILMDVYSGEVLAMANYPEYDSNIMTEGKNVDIIESYFKNKNNPFLNRAISGLYTPGSIIKPFIALAALEEKIIDPEKEIVSTGQLVVPNPYNPEKPSIFKDWKAHGAVDMRRALAVSSDVYFYQIGGGFEKQKGLGIEKIKKYLERFGFTQKTGFDNSKEETGTIPDKEWKSLNFDGEVWRVGDTYNTSIGQYGMQITPIQALVAVASIANGGFIVTPSILFTSTSTVDLGNNIGLLDENVVIVKEGMRGAVKEGTAVGLNVPYVEIAGKTGTAELGARKQSVNSWVIGFFPFDKPKYAFITVMERGPVKNLTGATYVMRQLFDWMSIHTPEYFGSK